VAVYGALADAELVGDVPVRPAAGEVAQDLELARAQATRRHPGQAIEFGQRRRGGQIFEHATSPRQFELGGFGVAQRSTGLCNRDAHACGIEWRVELLPALPRIAQGAERGTGVAFGEEDLAVSARRDGFEQGGHVAAGRLPQALDETTCFADVVACQGDRRGGFEKPRIVRILLECPGDDAVGGSRAALRQPEQGETGLRSPAVLAPFGVRALRLVRLDVAALRMTFPSRMRIRLRDGTVRVVEGAEPGSCGRPVDEQRAVVEEKLRVAG